jgi:hypothetical protein
MIVRSIFSQSAFPLVSWTAAIDDRTMSAAR